LIGSLGHQLNALTDLGVSRVMIDPCAKVGWQCTLSSDGSAPNTTVGQGSTPSDALQASISRFVDLHLDALSEDTHDE